MFLFLLGEKVKAGKGLDELQGGCNIIVNTSIKNTEMSLSICFPYLELMEQLFQTHFLITWWLQK